MPSQVKSGCESLGELAPQDPDVVDNLAKVLRRICDEPEEFSFRSLNLVDDEFRDNLGANEEAQQFLEELGFELIEEGPQSFMVFMQEQVEGLRGALKDVEARLKKLGVNPAVESNACNVAADDNLVESNDVVECNNVESNDVSSKAELGSGNVPTKDTESRSQLQEASPAADPKSQGESPASCEVTAAQLSAEVTTTGKCLGSSVMVFWVPYSERCFKFWIHSPACTLPADSPFWRSALPQVAGVS
ncbi:unnamed protein product [Symbiodinium necroappetens]|uniref:PUB domain-containing protein n=1 Tax=Symbiodinium necroappetens TaxID=1628268 RepID=A0A812N9Q5_9DINO|nr:unnamed protein product [Symbiodinium necroappetens]